MLTINNETYITTSEAADLTNLDQNSINRLARAGKVKAVKIGKVWAICKQSTLAYDSGDRPKPKPKSNYRSNVKSTKKQSITMRLKAMQLGHKLRNSPDGRAYCTKCQETVTAIAKGNMRCGL